MRSRLLNLSRLVPLVLLLLLTAACSGTNLGQIDESVDSREEMPGPGIFSDDEGESSLKWSSDSSEPSSAATATAASAATAADTDVTQEQAEFEQFKIWHDLRSNGSDSAEYQEFQQWLEYQKFKSSQ
ncbi:hypothetical protein N8198_10645 [Gammaproteobacteria bacterium]|nr:hypothetical protein [Gammaproteobacteria bacterium]